DWPIEAGLTQAGDGVLECPDAGEDELVRGGDRFRIARDLSRGPDPLEPFLDTAQVGHPIIDDDNPGHHFSSGGRANPSNRTMRLPKKSPMASRATAHRTTICSKK